MSAKFCCDNRLCQTFFFLAFRIRRSHFSRAFTTHQVLHGILTYRNFFPLSSHTTTQTSEQKILGQGHTAPVVELRSFQRVRLRARFFLLFHIPSDPQPWLCLPPYSSCLRQMSTWLGRSINKASQMGVGMQLEKHKPHPPGRGRCYWVSGGVGPALSEILTMSTIPTSYCWQLTCTIATLISWIATFQYF